MSYFKAEMRRIRLRLVLPSCRPRWASSLHSLRLPSQI